MTWNRTKCLTLIRQRTRCVLGKSTQYLKSEIGTMTAITTGMKTTTKYPKAMRLSDAVNHFLVRCDRRSVSEIAGARSFTCSEGSSIWDAARYYKVGYAEVVAGVLAACDAEMVEVQR